MMYISLQKSKNECSKSQKKKNKHNFQKNKVKRFPTYYCLINFHIDVF